MSIKAPAMSLAPLSKLSDGPLEKDPYLIRQRAYRSIVNWLVSPAWRKEAPRYVVR